MSEARVYSCSEGAEMFRQKKDMVILPNPEPFNTSRSSLPQFTGLDGMQPVFVTKKLTMPNYAIGPAEMPSKTTFPLQSSAKLNVPVNPDKELADLCEAALAWGIKAVEEKKTLWKIPEHKSAQGLFGPLVKKSSDPKWPDTVNFKIAKASSLILGGSTIQDSKGKWKIDGMQWKKSKDGPVQVILENGKSYDAPRIFMALPGDGTKYTDKIIDTDPSGVKEKRFLNWGDVKKGSEIEIQFKFGKVWYTPMGITLSLEIVQALFYPPAPKTTTSFAGKRCVEPTDDELLAATEGVSSMGESEGAAGGAGGGGFVPTFDEDENVEAVEKPAVQISSPTKESSSSSSSSSSAPGAPKKKRKTTVEAEEN